MTSLKEWFDSEKRWRSAAAAVWTLLLVISFTFAVTAVGTFDLFDVLGSIAGILFIVTDMTFWSNVFGICVVEFIIFRLTTRYYKVCHYVPSNQLRLIAYHLNPVRIFYIILHMICGGLITWFLTRITGKLVVSLVLDSTENINTSVLNEQHTFILLHGVFVGGFYGAAFFLTGRHIIHFPIVQQTRFFRVKGQLFSLLLTSASRSFRNMKYFYIIYYFFCASTVQWWLSVYGLPQNKNSNSDISGGLDTISGLLSLSLAFSAWFCGMFVDFVLSLVNLLYIVYETQSFEFPIEPTFEHLQDMCLHRALICNEHLLLQYLACLDLSQLAKHSRERRMAIFSVSPLGGHPLNWTNIASACSVQLKDFVDQIVAFNDCPTGQKTVGHLTDQQRQGQVISRSFLRPRSTHELSYQTADVCAQQTQPQIESAKRIFVKLSEIVRNHSVVTYFIANRPELLGLQLFSQSQKYIWLISGLSHLVAASYTEDTYGVVQQTLPEILTVFLNLLEALNRHLKQFPVRKRNQSGFANIHSLKLVLKETVKEAIYKIVITFDTHLSSIPLSAENTRRLQMFKEFKE